MKIARLTHKNIKPYGRIIDAACVRYKSGDNGFGIVFKEKSAGWRIAYLVVRKDKIVRLEKHPNTAETFESVKGKAVIALARGNAPDNYELFFLDKPVVLKKGVWHNVAAITNTCDIKICEAIKVVEAYYDLQTPIVLKRISDVR